MSVLHRWLAVYMRRHGYVCFEWNEGERICYSKKFPKCLIKHYRENLDVR
jgi:hypothetical protein